MFLERLFVSTAVVAFPLPSMASVVLMRVLLPLLKRRLLLWYPGTARDAIKQQARDGVVPLPKITVLVLLPRRAIADVATARADMLIVRRRWTLTIS